MTQNILWFHFPAANAEADQSKPQCSLRGHVAPTFHGGHLQRPPSRDTDKSPIGQSLAEDSLHCLNAFVVERAECGREPEQFRIGERSSDPIRKRLAREL